MVISASTGAPVTVSVCDRAAYTGRIMTPAAYSRFAF